MIAVRTDDGVIHMLQLVQMGESSEFEDCRSVISYSCLKQDPKEEYGNFCFPNSPDKNTNVEQVGETGWLSDGNYSEEKMRNYYPISGTVVGILSCEKLLEDESGRTVAENRLVRSN